LHVTRATEDDEAQDTSVAEIAEGKSNLPKKNDACPCGSNFRYKKCCLAIDKSRIRKEKFKLKNGHSDERESKEMDDKIQKKVVEGSFNILTI
jgi:hypothetical protein